MADKFVPVRYIGKKDSYRDHLYGTGITWQKGEMQLVPGYLFDRFMSHADMFQDARVGKMKRNEIDRTRPKQIEDDEPPLVNLAGLTKENLVTYAKRNLNLDISQRTHKEEMIEIVRRQMGTDMPVGAY